MNRSTIDFRLLLTSAAGGLATIVALQVAACPSLNLQAADVGTIRALLQAFGLLFTVAFVHALVGNTLASFIERLAQRFALFRKPLIE